MPPKLCIGESMKSSGLSRWQIIKFCDGEICIYIFMDVQRDIRSVIDMTQSSNEPQKRWMPLDRRIDTNVYHRDRRLLATTTLCVYLEISVNDSVLMAVVDALQDLLDAVRRIGFAVEFTGDNIFEQFTTSHPEFNYNSSIIQLNFFFLKIEDLQVKDEVMKTLLLYAVVQSNYWSTRNKSKQMIIRSVSQWKTINKRLTSLWPRVCYRINTGLFVFIQADSS